jgi:hypothetical protein
MIAMDEFVKDDVPLGVVVEVDGRDKLVEVTTVVVDIAAHPDFALVRQMNGLADAAGVELTLLGGAFERLKDGISVGLDVGARHGGAVLL